MMTFYIIFYLIFKVIIVNAARIIVNIQKRMVILDSWNLLRGQLRKVQHFNHK